MYQFYGDSCRQKMIKNEKWNILNCTHNQSTFMYIQSEKHYVKSKSRAQYSFTCISGRLGHVNRDWARLL